MVTQRKSPKISVFIAISLLLFAPASSALPEITDDGLYATFTISQGGSPLGDFTARLDYERVPRTVANFVGLAEGTQTWIDPVTFTASGAPFYDGIIFHRVDAGFVIQGGSPQGNGSDGPGYTFRDEFDPTLRHDAAGILSMANSGPDTNGSQFFVTLAATPWLDDVHSVFGTIVDGIDVVETIGAVSVDGDDRPLTDVMIDSVVITRIGAAAQAFDPSAQPLPRIETTDVALTGNGSSFDATYSQQADRQYFTATSTDLDDWTALEKSAIIRASEASAPGSISLESVFDTATSPKGFLRQAAVHYPEPILSPPDTVGKTLVLSPTDGAVLSYTITTPPEEVLGVYGSASLNAGTPGDLTYYLWTQEANRVRFFVRSEPILPILANLVFETAESGSFTGTADPGGFNSFSISGTFTFSDTP